MKEAVSRRFAPLLQRLGKRFGIDANYFARNGLMVVLAHGVAVLKGLITGYLITRLFPVQMYGEYKFVVNVVATVGVFSLSGLPTAIARLIARKEPDIPMPFTMKWHAAFCLLSSLALLGVIPFLGYWHRESLWPMFLISALLFVPSNVGTTFFGGYVIGSGKFNISLRASWTSSLLICISVLLMLLLHPSATLLIAFTVGIPAIIYLNALRKLLSTYPSKRKGWDVLQYAWKLTFADLPMSLSWYLDGLLIPAFFGFNQLAIFAVANMIPDQVKLFSKELMPISFSKQAAGKNSMERRRHLISVVGKATLLLGCGVLLYILLAPWFIPLLFPKYPAHDVIRLTTVAAIILMTLPCSLFTQHLEARGHLRELRNAQWIASCVFVIALFIFIPLFGPMGALIARGLFRVSLGGYAYFAVLRAPLEP